MNDCEWMKNFLKLNISFFQHFPQKIRLVFKEELKKFFFYRPPYWIAFYVLRFYSCLHVCKEDFIFIFRHMKPKGKCCYLTKHYYYVIWQYFLGLDMGNAWHNCQVSLFNMIIIKINFFFKYLSWFKLNLTFALYNQRFFFFKLTLLSFYY